MVLCKILFSFLLLAVSQYCVVHCECENYEDGLELLKNGTIKFKIGDEIPGFLDPYLSIYPVEQLEGYDGCLGIIITTDETIILNCPGKTPEEPGCYDIYPPESSSESGTTVSTKVQKICAEVLFVKLMGNHGCALVLRPNDDETIVFKWFSRRCGAPPLKPYKTDPPKKNE